MQTITTRTVSAPPIRQPLGGHFELTLNLTGLSLTGKTVRFVAVPANDNSGLDRYLLDSVQDATEIAVSGSTIAINVPPSTPSNDDAQYLLSELVATGSFAYSVTITDDAEDDQVLARVQGNVTWIRDTGKFKDSAQGASVFDLTIANGAVISLEISVVGGGATVDNESVNDAIEEDAAATRSSLGLGSAALAASSAFATAAQGTAADAAKATTDHLTVTQPVDLDAMESKLAGVEAGATADQTDAEIRTAYENERTVMSQAEAEAGSETTVRLLNALRIKQAVDARIAQIIDGSPTALDTLNELAAALGDDPNFATTMATALAGKQPIDATLTAFAALVGAANKLPYFSGDDTFTLADFTAAARTLLAAADAAAQRTALGLGSAATGDFSSPPPIGDVTPNTGAFSELTSADSVAISNMTDVWEDSGTTFYADKMAVTDTASAAESRLFSRWIGASEKIGVRKDGRLYTYADILVANGIYLTNAVGNLFFYFDWAGNLLCGVDFQPLYDDSAGLGKTDRRWKRLWIASTVTAGGTTGAQTINKASGSVNFAAAATSLVVTNSLVSSGSHIFANIATNDATMKSVQVVPGSGSFTIYADAAPTGETRVDFFVVN